MKCPKCSSANVHSVGVRDPKWRLGTSRCEDCGHQSDWLDFCDISPAARERAKAATAPLKEAFAILERNAVDAHLRAALFVHEDEVKGENN